MADFTPHPLVSSLAEKLVEKGARALARQSDEDTDRETPTKEELANGLADASDLPELMTFAGYMGGAIEREPDGRRWQLLYLDWRLLTWLLVPQDDIVFREALADETAPFKSRDVIWVRANALVTRGTGPQSAQERFLRGDFTRAGDFAASLTGGTFSPSTGLFCEATTASCCGRRTRA